MKKQNINSKEGFTIIEVVLVLAIAGLIFLMVFIALPALQRSQRDTQRRDDMARFLSQLNQYQANNAGRVPAADTGGYNTFIANYLRVQKTDAGGTATDEDQFVDPSGQNYQAGSVTVCTAGENGCQQASQNDDYKTGSIRIYTNATCEGENPTYIQGDRKVAITYKLEGAGIYCGNS